MIWLTVAGLCVVVLLVLAAGWRDLLSARSRLEAPKATLDQITQNPSLLSTSAGRSATTQQLAYAIDEVGVAHQIVVGSVPLKLLRFIPVLSSQRSGVLRLIDDSRTALTAGDNLITEADQLVAQGKVTGAQVPIASLATFETDLRAAGTTIVGLNRSDAGLLGPLRRARQQFDTLALGTGNRLVDDASAVDVGRTLLGAGGVRHYFVALENNAEMRDQGAILSYALLTVDDGHVQVTDHGPILTPIQVPGKGVSTTLLLKKPAPIQIPAGTAAVFGSILPTETWQSVNASADFDFTGEAIQAMYHQATGQSVDGVIALDVPALAALLTVVGPVNVPDINVQITAKDAGTVILHDLYNSFTDNQQIVRKELLSEVVTEVVSRLSTGSFDPLPLAQQLATAAAGGHMRIWSDNSSEEATLERIGLGGGPATTDANRTFHLAVEDRNATKVDYYVQTAAEQKVMITKAGTAIIQTTIIVHNGSPVGAAPSYQLGPDGITTTKPGEYWAWVLLWGPAGSDQPESVSESGLQLTQTVLPRIYAGQTAEVVFDTVIPNAVVDGKLNLRYVPQPRLTPPGLSVTIQAPGWKISGNPTWAGSWDRTVNLSWGLHR
jgi:hypothetical protein